MTTTVNLRKLLHRKAWEACTSAPIAAAAGSFVVSDKYNVLPGSRAVYVAGVSSIWFYEGDQDAWQQLPSSGATGTFAAGSCGELRGLGAMGGVFTQTATGGSTSTIVTNKTIVRSMAGRRIRVVAGAGIGYDAIVSGCTLGANAVLTVPVHTVAFDATTQFQLYSGSLWFFNAGTTAVGFSVYDFATNSWTARSVTNLPTAFGITGQLVSTLGAAGSFATGTATAGAATTLTNSAKAWAVNMWANYQVRITAGTGKGQIRLIASNTSAALTVSTAWTVNPDATSVYSIEGNEDCFYLMGNNSTALYKYSVAGNTWVLLAPTVARAAGLGTGGTLDWIDGVTGWDNEVSVPFFFTTLFKQNGRYLYSFRGAGTNSLDVYDIAANTWINALVYGAATETLTTGSYSLDLDGKIYLMKEATGRIFVFDVAENDLKPFATSTMQAAVGGAAVEGDKGFFLPYTDGGTTINWLYHLRQSGADLVRMMVI